MSLKQTVQTYFSTIVGYITSLRDVRVAGQLLFVIIVLLVSWSGVKAIEANYTLQKQIAAQEEQNRLQELENANLQLQNSYYNSPQYLELSARQNFGLGKPGETELIVPKSVALAYTVPIPERAAPTPHSEPPAYQRNLQSWMDFFLHRQQAE